ncbi:DUF3352 domain-containing protein [Humisphaera borealis]|uniref:DUF3352 domain-containing protein n=1 Tax=Humisphaera borealis TaxID=2807512 RepID=A0A7M2WVD5_9BACT|nr:DUF3352 domain-containing protein [Humisphaera borealis]QOV88450.1 hypothetical protein IPV69_19685 [Humisphaera borealis]
MSSRPLVRNRSLVVSLSLLLVASLATAVRAQPLADRVPADTLIYVGWLGYDAKSPGFAGSHLEAVMQAAEFKKLVDETLPGLLAKVAKKDANADQVITLAKPIVMPMLKHPTAIFVAKPVLAKNQQPMPKGGIICQAGPDAEAMNAQIQKLLADGPPDLQQMVKLSRQGDTVAVTIGYEAGLPAGGGLSASAAFKSIEAHTVKNSSLMVYVDVEALTATVEQAIDLYAEAEEPRAYWPKIRDAIGLKSVKRFVWSSGFDGKEWMDHLFLSAPEPRTGLVALADPTPVSEAALKSIPMTATLAGASKFDVAKLIAGVKKAVVEVEPGMAREIERAFGEASKAIGMDIEKDLLATLGDEWVYYVDPMTGGRGLGGIVMLNRLKDAAKAEAAFGKLETLVNDELKKNIREEDVEIKFRTTKSGGTTIHYLGTPLVSPAWAIKDGHLLIGLFPQMVAGAADQIGATKSILDNPSFQAVRTRLGVANASEVVFMDLPKTAPDSYATWVAISRLVNFSDVLGVPAPAMLLPPLNKLMPHLTPAGSVTWTDKDGIHVKAISSFPGATILASDPLGGMQMMAPMMMGVAMPAMQKAREQAGNVKSMSNLRQIALAAIIYANEKNGALPNSMAELVVAGDLSSDVLISPSSGKLSPKFDDKKELGRWAEENADYIWVGKGLNVNKAGPDVVIAHERLGMSPNGRVNVAFADGHVEQMFEDDLADRLKKAQK